MGTAQAFNFVQIAAIAAILIVALLFAWWYAQRPSHMREWQPDVALLATAEIQGHHVTVKNVRNFRYRSTIDFDERWEERHFDLTMLDGLDVFFVYWGSTLIAHTILSWSFDDGQRLAISIEARKRKHQLYSAWRGSSGSTS